MAVKEEICACVECVVRIEKPRAMACGHPRCSRCEREHQGRCGACNPAQRWKLAQAVDWLVKHYFSDDEVKMAAARPDGVGVLHRWAKEGGRGASGPHEAAYDTANGKVTMYDPQGHKQAGLIITDPTLIVSLKDLATMTLPARATRENWKEGTVNKKRRDIQKIKEQEAAAGERAMLSFPRSTAMSGMLRAGGVVLPTPHEEGTPLPKKGGTPPEQAPAVSTMQTGRMMTVPLDLIDDNPWQPRATVDDAALRDLADNIAQVGLLQSPVGRPSAEGGGRVQLAFGHRRVAAIRLLAEEGKWTGPVPVVMRPLTDASMAILSLSENKKRKDITPLEEYRAYRKALDEIEGLTVASLADSIGLDRSTLSNNLRILQLPAVVLDRFASGELSGHAAREFLCLMNDTHVHEEEMAAVVKQIAETGMGSAPDWRTENVRRRIRYYVAGNENVWRPLASKEGDDDGAGGCWREPTFDVDAFVKEHAASVHTIPASKAPSRLWTCNVREWMRRQSRATRQLNMEVKEGKGGQGATLTPGTPESSASQELKAVLAKDPVLAQFKKNGSVSPLPPGIEKAPKELLQAGKPMPGLTVEETTALGTRARVIEEYKRGGFTIKELGEDVPGWFPDIEECRKRCTWGAAHMTNSYRGGKPVLVCLNGEHFRQKMALGLLAFQSQLKETIAREDVEDRAVADAVAWALQSERNALKGLAVALLVGKQHFALAAPLSNTPGVGYELQNSTLYERGCTRSARLLLGLGKDGGRDGGFTVTDKVLQAVDKMDSEKLRMLVGWLTAHLLREIGWAMEMPSPSSEGLAHEEQEDTGAAESKAPQSERPGPNAGGTPIVVGDKVRLPMPGGAPYRGVYTVEEVDGDEAAVRVGRKTLLRYAVKALTKVEPEAVK